jgi:hypothetical protein
MAKATDKQLDYLNKLNEQAAEEDKIDNWDIIKAANDKFDGTKLVSAMIDQLKAKAPARNNSTQFTAGPDNWVSRRNGPGRWEADNNTF